jgi:hypothetical protein
MCQLRTLIYKARYAPDGATLQGVAGKFVICVGEISATIVTNPDMQVRRLEGR